MIRNFGLTLLLTSLIGIAPGSFARADTRIVSPAAPQATPSAVPEVLQVQLKNAVIGSAAQLPAMDPIQKKIFDDEVVPQYPLFIRDYRRVGQSVDAAVDLDGVKNMIRFSTQKTLSQPGAKILLYLAVDAQCPKCVNESAIIRDMMIADVERRGFTPVWVANEELAGQSIADLTTPHGAVGFLRVDMTRAPSDDEDAAHEDENKFISKAHIEVHGIDEYHDQAEFYDTDTFESETRKLLTHSFTDLGSKSDLASASLGAKDDMRISVTGFSDFSQYRRVKLLVQRKLKDMALLDERRLSRGKAVWALKTRASLDEVKKQLKGALTGEDQALKMEIQ